MVPDIASISFKLAQLTVKSEQPNFGPISPHFAETTSSSTDLSTLVHSCAPFDTMTSRSERQDHFGSDFVVIRAAMPFALLRLRSFEVGCGCSHDQNSPRIAKKPMSSLGSNIASLGLTIFVGFHQRSVHSEPPPRKTTIFFYQKGMCGRGVPPGMPTTNRLLQLRPHMGGRSNTYSLCLAAQNRRGRPGRAGL
jgi:hypothetical protein